MQSLQTIAKLFFGIGIAGIGVLHFLYPGFRPVILPLPHETTKDLDFLVYLAGAALVLAGLFIGFAKKIKTVSLLLGLALLLLFLTGHLPQRLTSNAGMLAAWTDALKLLALSGGAFVISRVFPFGKNNAVANALDKIAPYGKYFFALMLIVFGIDHFLYPDFVKLLVPAWIPGPLFWTYFGAVALIAAGLAIFLNFKPGVISILLGVMLLIWLIVLHIPRAIVAPATDNGNEWISVLECLAFSGIAFLYPYAGNNRNTHPPSSN